jgi:hypothetical protein
MSLTMPTSFVEASPTDGCRSLLDVVAKVRAMARDSKDAIAASKALARKEAEESALLSRQCAGDLPIPTAAAPTPAPNGAKKKPVVKRHPDIMPNWGDELRLSIYAFVRSALFSCSQAKTRRMFVKEVIASARYFKIEYNGEELRQRDLALLSQLMHNHRGQSLNDFVYFNTRQLLRDLGWSESGRSYQEVQDAIERMRQCDIKISVLDNNSDNGEIWTSYAGALIAGTVEHSRKGSKKGEKMIAGAVKLNHDFSNLMVPGGYTTVEFSTLSALSPLGRWLANYFSSHSLPAPVKVAELFKLSGATYAELRAFRRDLRDTLKNMVASEAILSFDIDKNDAVTVRMLSRSSRQGAVSI